MPRIFEGKYNIKVTSEDIEKALLLLANHIANNFNISLVVGIGRGGEIPAIGLSKLLRKEYYSVQAKSNLSNEIRSKARSNVLVSLEDIKMLPVSQEILVVDDIAGSGETQKAVTNLIVKEKKAKKVVFVVLCRNLGCETFQDAWSWNVENWVIFPWEDSLSDECLSIGKPSVITHSQ